MSVLTLYQDAVQATQGNGQFDLLGSEIGDAITSKLGDVPRIAGLLGEDWKLQETTIPDKEITQEERQRYIPVVTPTSTSRSRKRALKGQVKSVSLHHRAGSVSLRAQAYFVTVLQWFNIEGKIGDEIQFFGHFWDDHGTLKYYVLFQFPNAFVDTFFEYAYWPERKTCSITKPRVLIFSHETVAFHAKWGAGIYLLTDFQFGANLKAAAGNPDLLFFGGSIGVDQEQFTFDFFTWPEVTLKFGGGKVEIEKVRLYAKTEAWSDGEPPRIIEGDPEEVAPEDEAPDPHEVQFSLQGRLKISDEVKPAVWTTLPADTGVICWNLSELDLTLPSAANLDALAGEQAWFEAVGGALENYQLFDLAIAAQLPDRSLSYLSYEVEGPLKIVGACPETLQLDKALFLCTITEPGKLSRTEVVQAEGLIQAYGTTFEVTLNLPDLQLELDSIDGEGSAKWKETYWYKKLLELHEFDASSVEESYRSLHVKVDLKEKRFWAWVTNENGDTLAL